MLRSCVGDEWWLVHQPDHARVAGYLAAHWGNAQGGFARPGEFSASPQAAELRQEVVQGIAEHDNGWWEWEASPSVDPADGLPRDLPNVSADRPDAGLQRWRLGVPRLAESHPYVSLLISYHAYWLYAFAFDDLPGLDNAFRHPVFGQAGVVNKLVANATLTRDFLREQQAVQQQLERRLQGTVWAEALQGQHLFPHVRLLQILDALSLLISYGGQQELALHDVPRTNWQDRVKMSWDPLGKRHIVCDPYPFDVDPLEVYLPVRILPAPEDEPAPSSDLPLVRLHATPLETIRFTLVSKTA